MLDRDTVLRALEMLNNAARDQDLPGIMGVVDQVEDLAGNTTAVDLLCVVIEAGTASLRAAGWADWAQWETPDYQRG